MNSEPTQNATAIYMSLVYGRGRSKSAAKARLQERPDLINIDFLRTQLMDAIEGEYAPPKYGSATDPGVNDTRSWLLSALGRVAGDNTRAAQIIRAHLDEKNEPDMWSRYWALEGLAATHPNDLAEIAKNIYEKDSKLIVKVLALAILASMGRPNAIETIEALFQSNDLAKIKPVLHSMRFAPVEKLLDPVCKLVANFRDSSDKDAQYQAVVALGYLPKTTNNRERAARTLVDFIAYVRTFSGWDYLRANALTSLGRLRVESTTPVLIEELVDDNPAVVSEAARALERTVDTRVATRHIIEAASKGGQFSIERLAAALRWMNRDLVVEELESVMISGMLPQHEIAQKLLGEIGGVSAFETLRARTTASKQYLQSLEDAEKKIRVLFDDSISDARTGFKVATIMDVIVFGLGAILIAVSATSILVQGGNLKDWAGVGITGGTGVAGIIYSLLIARPRSQVRAAVDHLMDLKIVFLGYLRQLHQVDQAYTRRLLEDATLNFEDVRSFSSIVSSIMMEATTSLSKNKPKQ